MARPVIPIGNRPMSDAANSSRTSAAWSRFVYRLREITSPPFSMLRRSNTLLFHVKPQGARFHVERRVKFAARMATREFDVIVIGGGHAGTEAALAAARLGCKTLLLTHSIETLGQMSCNPSIGGIGKGHLVKEIDALGGAMALATDQAGIQFRILNASKGPAVRPTRAQADRVLYRRAIRSMLENQPNLVLFQHAVDDVLVAGGRATGVKTQSGV